MIFFEEWMNHTDTSKDFIEFGTGTGTSTLEIAGFVYPRRVFTIDGFVGLPQTARPAPAWAGWTKGAFAFDQQEVLGKLKEFDNVIPIVSMIEDLESPETYGISNIGGVHIDVDIYESSLASLRYLDRCEWNRVVIRFDDWHGNNSEFDSHERASFNEFLQETGYSGRIIINDLVGICEITR